MHAFFFFSATGDEGAAKREGEGWRRGTSNPAYMDAVLQKARIHVLSSSTSVKDVAIPNDALYHKCFGVRLSLAKWAVFEVAFSEEKSNLKF